MSIKLYLKKWVTKCPPYGLLLPSQADGHRVAETAGSGEPSATAQQADGDSAAAGDGATDSPAAG